MSVSHDPKEKSNMFAFTERPSIIKKLDELAIREGSSRSVIIRRAIRQVIEEAAKRESDAAKPA